MSKVLISVRQISKKFEVKNTQIQILKTISIDINDGDFLVVIGPSGSGKSTFLHIVIGLEEPSSGEVIYSGKSFFNNFNEDMRSEFRKVNIGMVFQQPNWIKSLNVKQNVSFALNLVGNLENHSYVDQVLEMVGMKDWSEYIPTELSSGQQQRVALARAIVTNPKIIVADEPTGNLDYKSGQEIMNIFKKLNQSGKTVIMVTHDLEYLKYANRAIEIFDGEVKNEINNIGNYLKNRKISLKKEDSNE
jgi:putative ABC transport system ATP-binding protein